MVSSILTVGDKIDIRVLQQVEAQAKIGEAPRVLKSLIYDLKENGILEIGMPTEAGKIVLLSLGLRYELVFYTKKGLYRCIGQVKERYKSDNLYMVSMEMKTNLSKFQRREYYRFECLLDISYLPIKKDEAAKKNYKDILEYYRKYHPEEKMREAIAVDISGGGLRFVTKEKLSPDDAVLINLVLSNETIHQEFWIPANILQVHRLDGDLIKYEHRVMFILKDNRIREQIIKYIFEEERKSRKNEKG